LSRLDACSTGFSLGLISRLDADLSAWPLSLMPRRLRRGFFTFKYCESDDLVHWKRIPDAVYAIDKYVGGPALYFADGWYYTLYVNSLSCGHYDTRITRSRDLIHWHDAPEDRPVLSVVPTHIPDPTHPEVFELSAADAELCYWQNKTIVYFHSGNQQGIATLQMAQFDGRPEELLAHYFDSVSE